MTIQYLINEYGWWPLVIGVPVMFLTSLIKIPIKLVTRLIKSTVWKDLVERLIIAIPVAIGIGLCYLKDYIMGAASADVAIVASGAASGLLAVMYYSLFGKYLEAAVLRILKIDVSVVEDVDILNGEAAEFATDILNGKPIDDALTELASTNVEEKKTAEAEDGATEIVVESSADGVVKAVCDYTGADAEMVATIIEKLKTN